MYDQNKLSTIEAAAQKGKAISSLLGTWCPLDAASREDLQSAFYALEGYFGEILEVLESSSEE